MAEERRAVTAYLRAHLAPDPRVGGPLRALGGRFALALVSSSATARLAACLEVTDLAALFPADRRFSAEDSLPVPTSKPDPAIYTFAMAALGIAPDRGLAIEDSIPGAQAAVAARLRTVGNVVFVPEDERAARIAALWRARSRSSPRGRKWPRCSPTRRGPRRARGRAASPTGVRHDRGSGDGPMETRAPSPSSHIRPAIRSRSPLPLL